MASFKQLKNRLSGNPEPKVETKNSTPSDAAATEAEREVKVSFLYSLPENLSLKLAISDRDWET